MRCLHCCDHRPRVARGAAVLPPVFLAAAAAVLHPATAGAADDAGPAAGPPAAVIIVRGRTGEEGFETRHDALPGAHLALRSSAGELIADLPSAYLPTNSRGESLVFLRNAAERQVAVFYEGAALNVPWDNRLDLATLPAGLVAGVVAVSGPLGPHYGANALGVASLSARAPAPGGEASLMLGEGGLHDLRLAFAPPLGGRSEALLGVSFAEEDGQPLAEDAVLPFSQVGQRLRTNTDRELASVAGRWRSRLARHWLTLDAFHLRAEKGIAPEGHLASGARFWRYPELTHTVAIANLALAFSDESSLSSVAWYQRFGQTIDSYTDQSYTLIDARQVDRDDTFGLRQVFERHWNDGRVIASFNFLESRHAQRDIAQPAAVPPEGLPARLIYRQRNWSIGGELEHRLGRGLVGSLGFGYDRIAYLGTGDKPPLDPVGGWTGRAAIAWTGAEGLRLRAAIGRKLRAPTMRELYGTALNRFLVNPDLEPERIVTAEVALELNRSSGQFYLIPFLQRLEGTIDQRTVGRLRQRINLPGSRVTGVEAGGEMRLGDGWQLSGSATLAEARRRGAGPGESDRLAEKPELLARARLSWTPDSPLAGAIELRHVGVAYSADAAGELVRLDPSTAFDLELRYRLAGAPLAGELFLAADNLGDALIEPQLGLPAPGRQVRTGLRFSW